MSLFDDDFYSTKVSRRAIRNHKRSDADFPYRSGGGSKWSTIRIIFLSSFISAVGATLLFGWLYGGDRAVTANLPAWSGDPSERTIMATAKVKPAVVSIINEQLFSLGLGGKRLEDGDESKGILKEAGAGSGVIIEKRDGKAIIVTNYHVVADAHKVKAAISNGEVREAKIIGMDQITDLAVLEIDGKGVDVVAEIGDSSKLRDAEFVVAIGNPLGMGESTTLGIVSVIREIIPVSLNQNGVMDWEQEVIRVDAAINEGNSGGPLIDLNGKVVGINSMKIADFGVESIGYAIPINNAMPVIESLLEKGYVSRPYLGVYTLDLAQYWEQKELEDFLSGKEDGEDSASEEDGSDGGAEDSGKLKLPDEVLSGVIVLEAVGPSKEAGLQFNDVIVQLDGKPIGSTRELRKYLYQHKKIGEDIEVSFYRNGDLNKVKIKLGESGKDE